MFFELNEEDIFCQRTDPNFNTLLRSGGGGLFHPRRPGERTSTNEKEETTTTTTTTTPARERFLSRAVSPSTPRSAKTLESATLCAVDNERRRTNESIPRTFFVFNKTTLTRRKEENGAGRGVSSSSSSRKRARDPSPLSRSWNRVRKTALLVPSPSIDGVAECGVLCFVSRFLFLRNPNKRRVLTFFPKRKKMFKIKKKVKKNQTIFCRAKILQKRGKVPKRSTLSTKPRG